MTDLEIRAATEADLDAIDEIEQHSFKSPWTRKTFEGELTREWAHIDLVLSAGRIIAFCDYWLVTPTGAQHREHAKEKKGAEGELHVLAIATHPDFRGKGVGGVLMRHVLARARDAGCSLATLEVRRSNTPAIALYERAGFKTVHVRARYYQDDNEDALVMLRGIGDESPS